MSFTLDQEKLLLYELLLDNIGHRGRGLLIPSGRVHLTGTSRAWIFYNGAKPALITGT